MYVYQWQVHLQICMKLQDIRNLIRQDDTPGAIEALDNLVDEGAGHNQRLRNDLIILSNRYKALKHKETLEGMKPDDALREYTLVNQALLNLIDEMETGKAHKLNLDAPATLPLKEPASKQRLLLILGGIVVIILLFFFFRSPEPVPPTPVVINVDGYWQTNLPPLQYLLIQNGESYTWQVVGAPDIGTGRIQGNTIISQVGGRDVTSYVSAWLPDGRPSELKSNDPQFSNLILYRSQ